MARSSRKGSLATWCVLCALVVAILSWQPARADGSRTLALLVGIGNYQDGTAWGALRTADDVEALQAYLLDSAGADASRVRVLHDPPRGEMVSEISRLVEDARPGDHVMLYLSGHGCQVWDRVRDADDEVYDPNDGMDEAIVPSDCPGPASPGHADGVLRDDYFNLVRERLLKRVQPGGSVLLVSDTCSSGGILDLPEESQGVSGSWVVLSACQSWGAALDTHRGGQFTQLCLEILRRRGGGCTYRELVDLAGCRLGATQVPAAAGSLDLEFLSGRSVPRAPCLRVLDLDGPSGVWLNKGTLHGITVGQAVAFYALETREPASAIPVALGQVTSATPFRALVVPTGGSPRPPWGTPAWPVASGSPPSLLDFKVPDDDLWLHLEALAGSGGGARFQVRMGHRRPARTFLYLLAFRDGAVRVVYPRQAWRHTGLGIRRDSPAVFDAVLHPQERLRVLATSQPIDLDYLEHPVAVPPPTETKGALGAWPEPVGPGAAVLKAFRLVVPTESTKDEYAGMSAATGPP